jgi:hypothetical protein
MSFYPESGQIWIAKFPFDEKGKSKVRPVFILDVKKWGVQVAYLSTKKVDEAHHRTEVLLNQAEATALGLYLEGRIDFGRRATIALADLRKYVGHIGAPGEKLSTLKFREMAEAAHAAGL